MNRRPDEPDSPLPSDSAVLNADRLRAIFDQAVLNATAGGSVPPTDEAIRLLLELRVAEFDAVIQSMPDAVYIGNEHGITRCNPQALEMLGFRSAAELNREVSELSEQILTRCAETGERIPPAEEVFVRALQGQTSVRDVIVRHLQTGKDLVLRSAAAPIRLGDRIIGAVVVNTDITDRQRTAQELKALNETLEQRVAERTAQLRALATELTQAEQRERRRLAQTLHDHLQQLLVAAKLNVGVLRGRVADPKLRQIVQQVDELLNESIEASRSLTVELSPPVLYDAGLAPALEWLARWMRDRHGLTVAVETDDRAEPVGDELKVVLFEAVRELLFNVVKHARVDDARVSMQLGEHVTEVVVSDQGQGFDLAALEGANAAHGFGLFSIHQRLGLLGGAVAIESSPQKGTRVTLTTPLPDPVEPVQSAPVTPAAAPPSIPPAGKIRVLIADDQRILRAGLARLLQDQPDIEVVGEAVDGQAAVDLTRDIQPDVVIMDITMPKMNGIEATRRIAAESPKVRVIGLSFHEEEDVAAAMKKAGAAAYLTKGGPTDDLIAAIRGPRVPTP